MNRIRIARSTTGRCQVVALGLAGDLTRGGTGAGSENKRHIYCAR